MSDKRGERPGEHEHPEKHWGEAVIPSATHPPEPGDLVVDPVRGPEPEPIVGSGVASPLGQDEPEGVIPPSPLWAMKDLRHVQWQLPVVGEHERIRAVVGEGDDTAFLIDDGRHHAMVGRQIGVSVDGAQYSLVGRITAEWCHALLRGTVAPSAAFDDASHLTVCGVVVDESIASGNVFEVARYRQLADVPDPYRPGAPYLRFSEDLEITV